MQILDCNKFSDIISWTVDGKAFVIKDSNRLEQTVLSDFKALKFDSFVRKVFSNYSFDWL